MFEYVNKGTLYTISVYHPLYKCGCDSPKMLCAWCAINVGKLLKQNTTALLSVRHLSEILERYNNYLN